MNDPSSITHLGKRKAGASFGISSMVRLRRGETRWDICSHLVDELLNQQELRISQWLEEGRAEVVKTGDHRTVYRLRLPVGNFYLKHYRIPGLRARLQNVVRPCKAMLEFEAACRVAEIGIATYQPVAVGRTMTGPVVRDNFLVSDAIDDAQTLHEFVLETFKLMPQPRRNVVRLQIARQLGEMVARLHAADYFHRDLHAGNVLIRIEPDDSVRLWLIDLHALGGRQKFSIGRVERNLSLLNNFFVGHSSATDRLRFLRSYWRTLDALSKATPSSPPAHNRFSAPFAHVARRLEEYCWNAVLQSYWRGDKKWVRGNRHLVIANTNSAQCRGVSILGASRIEHIRENPEQLFDAKMVHSWHRRSSTRRVARVDVDVDGKTIPCYVTAIRTEKNVRSSGRVGSYSQLRRAWEAGHAMLRRRINTAKPLLYVETGSSGDFEQYLLTEAISDAVPLPDFLEERLEQSSAIKQEAWIGRYLTRLAGQLGWMHRCGVDHQNLSADNILVSEDPEVCQLWFLGLANVHLRRRLSQSQVLASLTRFNGSVCSNQRSSRWIRRSHRLRFLRRYLGSEYRNQWKLFWRQIERGTQQEFLTSHTDKSQRDLDRLLPAVDNQRSSAQTTRSEEAA